MDYDDFDFEAVDEYGVDAINDAGELATSIQNEHTGEREDSIPWPGSQDHRAVLRRTFGKRIPSRYLGSRDRG